MHYKMIKNLPDSAMKYLLRMLNSFFKNSYFPEEWNTSIIIPIVKPGKNPACPTSYRPIALTSCFCKIMERLLNERLMEHLESKGILNKVQSGCRRNRSTIDNLVRLEDSIRTAFAKKEHFIGIFIDLERSYDMT